MKRIVALVIFAAVGMAMLPISAHAFCTQTSITSTNTSTKIIGANVSSSAPRRILLLNAGGACPVWCSVGDTAAVGLGVFVEPGLQFVQMPAAQLPPNSFPQSLNGQVNCILPANLGCTQTTVSACSQ